jgi:hypothetical protein
LKAYFEVNGKSKENRPSRKDIVEILEIHRISPYNSHQQLVHAIGKLHEDRGTVRVFRGGFPVPGT